VHTEYWSEKLKDRYHKEDLGADGRIILECKGNRVGACELFSLGSRHRPVACSCGNGDETLSSINIEIYRLTERLLASEEQ
jgi:hypothetical protein